MVTSIFEAKLVGGRGGGGGEGKRSFNSNPKEAKK